MRYPDTHSKLIGPTMKELILSEIKTDVIQGHLPAAKHKIEALGHKLGNDWIAMALVTTINEYLKDMMNSEDKYPSTLRVEVALATMDAHLDKIKDKSWKKIVDAYDPANNLPKIYLNHKCSEELSVPYSFRNPKDNSLNETTFVKLSASKIYKSTYPNAWDEKHKSILLPLVERGQSVMLESTTAPGWWKIISVVGG